VSFVKEQFNLPKWSSITVAFSKTTAMKGWGGSSALQSSWSHMAPISMSGKHTFSVTAQLPRFPPAKMGKIMHEKHCRIDDMSENYVIDDFWTPFLSCL
jgi:hypothetical protein